MDVFELDQALHKHSAVETPRLPLVPSERNNETTRRSRTREVSSRFRSPIPSATSGPRRSPSPSITRTGTISSVSIPKRAISAERKWPSTPPENRRPSTPPERKQPITLTEKKRRSTPLERRRPSTPPDRKRPSTPPSPSSLSTPVHDTPTLIQLPSRKLISSRVPEGLWPSTMRSLSVSFQSDTFSLPASKREKTVIHALSDRTLKQSSNVAHKQVETLPGSRKPTPERKRSPLKGKNAPEQSENSKPIDVVHSRLVDQHRWPSRTGGRVSSNALAKSIDLSDRKTKASITSHPGMVVPSLRRMSIPGCLSKPLKLSASDSASLASFDQRGKIEFQVSMVDDNTPRSPVVSSRSSERPMLITPAGRTMSLPSPGSRPPSPNKTSLLSSLVPRGASPSRTRTLNSAPSRGVSPSRIRATSPSRQSNSSTSVLSFITDIRKGKKVASHIEDVHELRLLYNRHLQWRYTNARADVALQSQKVTAEKTLYNVWRTTSELWDSVTGMRIDLQQLRLKLKLYSVLNEQMMYLNGWALVERDHTCALSGIIKDLQASTLRLPVSGGARADTETVKAAVCSAINVMQTMASSIGSILTRMDRMNCLVSELADVSAQERAMLDECEALLAHIAAVQEEEYSLRSHLLQLKQTWKSGELPIYGS